ncbi:MULTISPECIES: DUF1254 domain-containing protein [unclassified Mycolicibacterium]|uniref:DUF1254 domain-containing protein n=1 Tax=unclassified Mycolicibacterium TaxID=2636767 RepID=UPI0012DBD16B|nr:MULTISPECIES: DUF1254 domain-containing protein [unclassified Mycolicibacterium]MUL83046.1 DUF1254 domain-containing protein [Mycolicibacterium sp. CBMA 329]MUL89381.1 DUF1254 domain-containing protein [Mycolicibacterium sp. CBMA 331]MUL99070.1 DUF1254 domain-containing protein [Mycolicibacterium sp. CBMA 334]MUM24696.1 DUF1254 domain-containing protein [Mycolicibacterium sp. CBMA 295]MUM38897.1 DUF1254 domain-containing protein [Mycolicibacterium sp. CBMA 247]
MAATSACSSAPSDKAESGHLTTDEAKAIAMDAYVYGYSLVTVEMTRRVMTNVDKVQSPRAPMGQLMRMREYPNAAFRDVTAPNADTLYTNGFIDVKDEPWVLSLPEANDRYYLFPMLDGYTNVFEVPGKRTTGTGPQTYAITGPNWKGTLPAGVKEYKSPTSTVWLLGRIYCTGTPEDYAAVHKMQDAISLVPLSSYGKPYTPPAAKVDPSIDMKTPVRDQVNNLSTEDYFNLLATLMKDNPPAEADKPMVDRMAKLGIAPGEKFDIDKLGSDVAAALKSVPKDGFDKIMARFKDLQDINGWRFTTQTGQYGTEYLQRALITAIGLGANRPQDAVYPTSETGPDGKPYDGANKYVLHFDKDQLPPVNGFWSLTMYDEGYFFVDNPLNRYTLSQRNAFATNPDGSVDLYLQHDNPGPGREANWLPAPAAKFNLMLRLYWPKETPPSIIDGTWKPPAVSKVA